MGTLLGWVGQKKVCCCPYCWSWVVLQFTMSTNLWLFPPELCAAHSLPEKVPRERKTLCFHCFFGWDTNFNISIPKLHVLPKKCIWWSFFSHIDSNIWCLRASLIQWTKLCSPALPKTGDCHNPCPYILRGWFLYGAQEWENSEMMRPLPQKKQTTLLQKRWIYWYRFLGV